MPRNIPGGEGRDPLRRSRAKQPPLFPRCLLVQRTALTKNAVPRTSIANISVERVSNVGKMSNGRTPNVQQLFSSVRRLTGHKTQQQTKHNKRRCHGSRQRRHLMMSRILKESNRYQLSTAVVILKTPSQLLVLFQSDTRHRYQVRYCMCLLVLAEIAPI